MIIGVPKEIKADEYRTALLPVGAHLLVKDGHEVLVETQVGLASGFHDEDISICWRKNRTFPRGYF